MRDLVSTLIGPFAQIITMKGLPDKGALRDEQLEIIVHGGILIEGGKIKQVANYTYLLSLITDDVRLIELNGEQICLPSYIDCHTHILYGGTRAHDFAMRNAGSSYLEIASAGGGIWSTVQNTRQLTELEMVKLVLERSSLLLRQGITTIEVKSGYGLSIQDELKALRAIKRASRSTKLDIVSTCLAAHMLPKDYHGDADMYLQEIADILFPIIKGEDLSNRVDAFIEQSAFSVEQVVPYLKRAKELGFDITVHADQFTCSGSQVAVDFGAVSADHLEVSTDQEIAYLANSNTVAVALPAASLGLGCSFTPARKLLDAGASLAIATDWNPGSAPMGKLITSSSILATIEKLTNAEILAAITFRAAKALNLTDRGRLEEGFVADFVIYNTANYQDITYYQGSLEPCSVWKNGEEIYQY